MKRVVETEDAFYIFLFIPNTLSEKFHYKLLSGPCQSPASAPSNIIQRHLDLATTSSIETIPVTIMESCPGLVITLTRLWLWWLSLCLCPPTLISCTLRLDHSLASKPSLKVD